MIGIDQGMRQLADTGTASVLDLIKGLRTCRGGMVQHEEQAAFVQSTLERYVLAHGSVHELAILEESISKVGEALDPSPSVGFVV